MIVKQYHILNGDVLKERFPKRILGKRIVMRECLVEGNVDAKDLESFFEIRAKYIECQYGRSSYEYFTKVVPEINSIQKIPQNSEVNLWFEDDLFCQVNLWFVLFLLSKRQYENNSVYLVRPKQNNRAGFSGLKNDELIGLLGNRQVLKDLSQLSKLWTCYKKQAWMELKNQGELLASKYPFILIGINAQLERLPKKDSFGKPVDALIEIMRRLKTHEFDLIFEEFSKINHVYGFGDLQVASLIKEINEKELLN